MRGLVVKKEADLFEVKYGQNSYYCSARGALKKQGVFVGDKVSFDHKNLVINEVLPRKNILIRPPMCNLDTMIIVIAPKPQPDLYLVDKLVLFCTVKGINPVLCVNKVDQDPNMFKKIQSIYKGVVKVIKTSAVNNDISQLLSEIKGISAFAGQSAVGKSSLINSIFEKQLEKVGDFAKKVERGKQTTRTVTLYKFKNGYIADTAGFSKLDESLIDIKSNEVARYFPEFLPYIPLCKFRSCLHKNSKDCAVIKAVQNGDISQERYQSYLKFLSSKEGR